MVIRAYTSSLLLCLVFLTPLRSFALTEYEHPGYVEDVKEERLQVSREIVIVPYQDPVKQNIMEQIFTEKLSKEFSREFRRRFGYTEFEQLQLTSNRTVESVDSGRQLQYQDYLDKQESFGQYMAKELLEFHVDSYLRGNPSTREIYKAKEKISNIQVEARAGYKIKIRYKLTTNRINFRVEKPGEKFHKSVDAKINGEQLTARLAYDVTKTVRVGTDLNVSDEIYSLYSNKRLTTSLSTSITGQTFAKTIGETPKQERVLLGLTWND